MIVHFPEPAWLPQTCERFTAFPSKTAALRCIAGGAVVGEQWPGEPTLPVVYRVLELSPQCWIIGLVDDGEVIGFV